MKKFLYWLIFFIIPSFTFANCPMPHTIVYQCKDFNGKKICTWVPTHGWYQGSADYSSSLESGDHAPPRSFEKAIWFPYLDEQHGATLCYYIGPEGELITLFQQTGYGSVPPPKGSQWVPESTGEFPGGLECRTNVKRCQFDFAD